MSCLGVMTIRHSLRHWPPGGLVYFWELEEKSWIEVKCDQLHNLSLTNLDTSSKESSQQPPTKATWRKLPHPLSFFPTSRETYSGGELPSESLNEKAWVFWPFSSGTLCLHFQGPICHLGPLPLASISALGSFKLFKIVWEQLAPESWALQARRRDENPHIPGVRDGFNFCLFMLWLLYGFKPWSSWQGDQQCVCPFHSSHPIVPTFWGEAVAGTGPTCPDRMKCSGEAPTVIREEGPNLNLSLRKDEEVRFEAENHLSNQVSNTVLSILSAIPVSAPHAKFPTEDTLCWVTRSLPVRKEGPSPAGPRVRELRLSLTS